MTRQIVVSASMRCGIWPLLSALDSLATCLLNSPIDY